MRLNSQDRDALQQLPFDPCAEPAFELMKSCLGWPDERPNRISNEGYEIRCDLWGTRGFINRKVRLAKWGLNPSYYQEVWRLALQDAPAWPGFRRTEFSDVDRAYLDRYLAEASNNGGV
ncbi:MAG: hypothetical protein QM784_21975 [Polyangiaceae bacterium]